MNLKQLLHDHRIRVQGVVEVGAHIGEDIPPFIELGASKIVAIEPNPDIFPALHETAAAINKAAPGRCAVMQAAVAHQPGRAVLHVANEPQSSSLLPMTGHKELYPDIKEVKDIEVDVVTLDGIREDLAGCNILKMDIQGAELHALQGATEFLKQIDAIVIEVGYRMPLYAEAPLVEQIDAFLKDHEFTRVHSETPYSPYWGDALYTRNFIASTTIGRNGGFGNQIFQYMFLKVAHVETGRRVLTAPWQGQKIFGIDDPTPPDFAWQVIWDKPDELPPQNLIQPNQDVVGYFQFHTSIYAHYREIIQKTFTPSVSYGEGGKPLLVCHIRRGDYLTLGHDFCLSPSLDWYQAWLNSWDADLHEILIVSDDKEIAAGEMLEDWVALASADIVVCANSTFSISAAMMNQRPGARFFRPTWAGEMIEFDPWNCEVLLRRQTAPPPATKADPAKVMELPGPTAAPRINGVVKLAA